MRMVSVVFFSLTFVPCGLGQQKAKINCINAKSAPLLDPTLAKVMGWIKCGEEIRVIALQPDGGFYLIEAEIAGQTMRGNIDKSWLMVASPSPGQLAGDPPSFLPAINPPSIIGSTYQVSYPVTSPTMRARGVKTIRKTIHVYEPDEKTMKMDVAWPDGSHISQSIEYEKVTFVTQTKGEKEKTVDIETHGETMSVPVRTEDDAQTLAEYVAQKSPLHLELIGNVWRVRKSFECPEAVQIGCRDFKELLDHDDPDIVDSFYSRSPNTSYYACFSDSSRRFFIIAYGMPDPYYKGALLFQTVFIDGQSNATSLARMEWSQDGHATIFTSSAKQGKQAAVGYVTPSELGYQNKFTNKSGTETQYSVSIRWSTGRYIESFSFKDEKGKPLNFDENGICVKLN